MVTGDSLSMELLKTEKGNTTVALGRLRELQNTTASPLKTVRRHFFLNKKNFFFRKNGYTVRSGDSTDVDLGNSLIY